MFIKKQKHNGRIYNQQCHKEFNECHQKWVSRRENNEHLNTKSKLTESARNFWWSYLLISPLRMILFLSIVLLTKYSQSDSIHR